MEGLIFGIFGILRYLTKNSRVVPVLVDVATKKQSLIVHTLHLSLTFHYDSSYPVSPL